MSCLKFKIYTALNCLSPCSGETLDDYCNTYSVSVYSSPSFYYLINNQKYDSLCRVGFDSTSTTVLTISGSGLDCSQCHISVWDANNYVSKSNGNICSMGYFKYTYFSDYLEAINLHVQGTACANAPITIEARKGCDSYEFQCDNGQCVMDYDRCDNWQDCSDGSDEDGCFWSVGAYVGVSLGSFVFLFVVVVTAAVCRRRMVLARGVVVVPATQSQVTQGRW